MSDQLLSNVVILDVSKQSDFFQYFIIATGMTQQHLQSSSSEITRSANFSLNTENSLPSNCPQTSLISKSANAA